MLKDNVYTFYILTAIDNLIASHQFHPKNTPTNDKKWSPLKIKYNNK